MAYILAEGTNNSNGNILPCLVLESPGPLNLKNFVRAGQGCAYAGSDTGQVVILEVSFGRECWSFCSIALREFGDTFFADRTRYQKRKPETGESGFLF